jgi:prepilin-type N-terminal cleavage/methylation domain-containing protein/prepilin-type processing-associated H-X9-DG protein
MMDQGKNSSLKTTTKLYAKAFTLIELLVVIAIIALLLSIVMPALRKAKGAAESVVCRAHEKGIGVGLITYAGANKDYIPGPSTSGVTNVLTSPGYGSTAPCQNVDWISPSLGTDLGLPEDPSQRLLSILNTKLKCPSNKVKYDYIYPGGEDATNISYSSYSATMGFHMYPSNGGGQATTNLSGRKILTDWQVYSHFNIAKGYVPKLASIGTLSSKIYVIDGARYYDATKGTSFNNIAYQDDGGNFMVHGVSYLMNGDPLKLIKTHVGSETLLKPKEETLKLAFRHNGRINAVFFDGHCQTLTPEQAVKSSYYWPRNTYVTSAAPGYMLNQDPDLTEGFIR